MRLPLFIICLFAALGLGPAAVHAAGPADFEAPEPVVIKGYDGHAMEPFLSRDGELLFFNTRNRPDDQTDIHWAERPGPEDTDGSTLRPRFVYRGPLEGANSDDLDGVPSMARGGAFYFVSPRAYDESFNTLWQGRFDGARLVGVRPLKGNASRAKALWLNIDLEISADGNTLYFAENRWRLFGGGVKSSNLLLAERQEDGHFLRPDGVPALFARINTDKLEFAPATTADELTLYFTRADPRALRRGDPEGFGIFVSTRPDRSAPFGEPERIRAIRGYVEGPTVSPDGCVLYFHKLVGEVFRIYRARKTGCR